MDAKSNRLPMPYIVANGIAVAISLIAACLNFVIGPREPLLWLLPLFEAAYASMSGFYLLWRQKNRVERAPVTVPVWVENRLGKRGAETWKMAMERNGQLFPLVVTWLTPTFFLFASTLTFVVVILGAVNRR